MSPEVDEDFASDKVAAFLFMLETYHFIAHSIVLFGLRLLPRKDLVRQRFYFVIDTLTVFSVNFLYLGQLRWLAAIQMSSHFMYIISWEKGQKTNFCRRLTSWSSLDWNYSYAHRIDWPLIIGTTFDMFCHLANAVLLSAHLSQLHGFLALALSILSIAVVMFNPKYAWSTPSCVPNWVKKRVSILEEDVGIKRIAE